MSPQPLLPIAILIVSSGVIVAQNTDPTIPEIQRIFDADQKDRSHGPSLPVSQEEWKKLSDRDEARRKRVRQLIDAGALTTGKDYRQAAFVFQHGATPSDFLFAHLLAMAGVSKGDEDSRWIAAAALDRYLESVKQSQVFGTQFSKRGPSEPWTQEPYDRDLLPDVFRKAFCVPDLKSQSSKVAAMNRKEKPEASPVCR